MAKSSTPNSSNYSYNIVSNRENLDETKKKIIDDIKFDLFETMKIDELMVNRNILSDSIGKNRYENGINGKNEGIPGGTIVLKDGVEIDLGNKYSDLMNEYKRLIKDKPEGYESELKKLDTKLAERLTLDKGFAIEFKSNDKFDDGKSSEEEAKIAYDGLNELKDYKGKIDLVSKKKDNIDYFVIKWKPNQLEKIKLALNVINAVLEMKGQEAEKLQKDSDDNKKTIEELTKKLNEIDNKQADDGDKNNKKDEESDKNIKVEENKKDSENKAENNEKEKEEFLRKFREYCPWLFEGQDKKEKTEKKEEHRESIEENALYVSRHDVELSVAQCRRTSDYPQGTILIKGRSVKVEEFQFYEEMKQEYILAKGNITKLQQLDREFAELAILCSPRGVTMEHRYQIRLTEEEIVAGGLVVSQTRLARYGLAVDFFEYTNTIIEREYEEKIETIREIEEQIEILTRTITELTTKINIEKYSSEKIIEEIRIKKEKVRILKERLYALLISLRKNRNGGNEKPDEDLLALKDLEKRLMAELDELKKKKEHQEEVNKKVKELREKLKELKEKNKNKVNEEIARKERELKELNDYIELLRKQKNELEGKLDNTKISDLDKIGLKDEIAKKDAEIKKYEEDAKKLYDEIEKLKSNNDNKIAKELENEIAKLEAELAKLEAEQAGFDNDIDKKIADKEKELADVRKQIEEKESKNKKKVGLGEFEVGEYGELFAGYCRDNGITREDGKEIKDGRDIDTSAIYLKDGKRLKLEPRKGGAFGGDDNARTTYEFVYYEEAKEKKKVGLGEFEVGEYGELFAGYCRDNGITREDGKEIKDGRDIDTSAIYLKDGKRLKLEFRRGGAFGGDDNVRTIYEFVYYEDEEPEATGEGTSEIEQELLVIIHEQEQLEIELEELEHKLMIEKSEYVKIEIQNQIKIIQEEITKLTKKITEITNTTRKYKEKITQYRYRVYKVRPIPIPDWKEKESFEMTSVISDMGTDVFREKASLKVEEKLKAYYKSLGRWQVGSRLALFLGRGRRRKRMIRNEMNNMANTAFQTGAGYGALNEQSQNAADRHGHELATGMEAINKITTVHNQQVDQLCKDYLNNIINDDQFQQQFNQIIANDANVQNALNGQSITHIGTNILLRLQEQKALNQLILDMDAQLAQYVATGNVVHMDNMRNYVSQFIKDYQKTPAFMANFEQFVKGDLNARNQLRQYLNHQRAVMQMQITNLRMNIDILNKGKSAYQIDNKDREQGKGSWKFKLGHFMDKHPRGTVLSGVALSVGLGFLTAGTSAVVGAAISTGVFGAYVGTTNAVKKWTHHTKEQNTHEKNMATDYRNEQAKIQAWQNQALNGHGWRKYKAKRQLALYDQTTQENIKLSDQITEYITNLSSKVGPLTADEDNFMRCNLIEGWARLKYYRQMGHNFLASEQVDKTEKDMKRLEKAITLGLQKIGKTTNDIETNMTATNQQKTNITYAVIQNDLKASYDKSLIQFKRERRNLSLKYGIGTAAASIGGSLAFQYIFGTGVFTKETAPFNSTTTTAEYYNLGKHEGLHLTDSIANDTNSALSSVSTSDATGANLLLRYGGGTDATGFASTPPTSGNLSSKITAIDSYISSLPTKAPGATGPGLTATDKATFLSELHSLSGGTGTNGVLQNMRHADDIGQLAKGLSTSGKSGIFNPVTLTQDPALNVVGATTHTAGDRVANAVIEISKEGVPGKKSRFFGVPLFFNTFKDRKATKDTTDQNFGRGGQQQRQPQNP